MKKYWILLIFFLATSACAQFQTPEVTGIPIDPRVRAEQENELKIADGALEHRDFPMAETLYSQFQVHFPSSIFFQRSQFGLARSLEEQGRWAEAAELYRRTLESTREKQKEIAAQALYEISFCYENLGDEARILASLLDALSLKEYLSPEQGMAEIPARLAASYNRMGRIKEAEDFFQKAQAGVIQVRTQRANQVSASWLAHIYQRMGSFSTNQVSYENLQASLDTLRMVQIFSLRSAEAEGEPWSGIAVEALTGNYRDLWNAIRLIPLNLAMEAGAAKKEKADRQIHFTGQLLALMNDLRLYRMPEQKDARGAVKDLFSYLKKLEIQGRDLLLSLNEINPLTPEAKRREGLKREGLTVIPVGHQVGPGTKTDIKATRPPKIDPNL